MLFFFVSLSLFFLILQWNPWLKDHPEEWLPLFHIHLFFSETLTSYLQVYEMFNNNNKNKGNTYSAPLPHKVKVRVLYSSTSMLPYLHTHMHTCTHKHTHTHTHTHKHVHTHKHIHTHTHIHTQLTDQRDQNSCEKDWHGRNRLQKGRF